MLAAPVCRGMPLPLDEQAQRAGASGAKDGRNASTGTSRAMANLPIRAESIEGETIMRDSAQLRRDLTVVQRYLASLRTLHGDPSGRFARAPRVPATPPTPHTSRTPAGSTLSSG
jgi:hypothetical protein